MYMYINASLEVYTYTSAPDLPHLSQLAVFLGSLQDLFSYLSLLNAREPRESFSLSGTLIVRNVING